MPAVEQRRARPRPYARRSRSSASSGGTPQPQQLRVTTLQPALLPQVERRKPGGEREAGERSEHQPDVERERHAGAVARGDVGAAADPGEREQQRRRVA